MISTSIDSLASGCGAPGVRPSATNRCSSSLQKPAPVEGPQAADALAAEAGLFEQFAAGADFRVLTELEFPGWNF